MRYRIDTYSVSMDNNAIFLTVSLPATLCQKLIDMGGSAILTGDVLKYVNDSVRVIADETRGGYIMMSTGQKQTLYSAAIAGNLKEMIMQFPKAGLIAAANGDADDIAAINAIAATDQFTIEFDWGDVPLDQAKDSTVAKEAQATINKQEILARIGKSFAVAEDNVLKLHMVTLKQIESLWVKTSAGDVHFSITTDQSNYYLAFSSDSPQAIAGQAIEDDAVSMYNNDVIFPETVITFPSGWTITGVIIDGIDGNLLNEGDAWRLAELRRVISQIDMTAAQKVAAFFNITPPVPNAVPMTQQEVEDDLDELWNLIISQ